MTQAGGHVETLDLASNLALHTPEVPAQRFDVIVAGVGAMGSATVAQLARRGVHVLGLERSSVPNDLGSSGGVNRIIRLAYAEDPRYVPLLRRAYTAWRELEERSGERILVITGGVDAGTPESETVTGSLESCRVHDLPHEILDARELNRRYPGFVLPGGMVGVAQPDAGFVFSERAIAIYAGLAIDDGAEIHGNERVVGWEPGGNGVIVRTTHGEYRAGRLVLSAGAWMGSLMPPLASLFVPERQVLLWTQPHHPDRFRVGTFPVFILEAPEGRFYGFPMAGIPGFKIGRYHHLGEVVDPDMLDRTAIDAEDEEALRAGIRAYLPDADGPTLSFKTCLFTNTPDEHFVIDRYPDVPQVIVASPCSGHGFKFASVIGEILADLAQDREPAFDLSMFRLDRFGPAPTPTLPR
jgi:sarcosine oxidase